MDHGLFGKLPAPENEHRDRCKNDERLPHGDVEKIEPRTVVRAEPEERAKPNHVDDLDDDKAFCQRNQTNLIHNMIDVSDKWMTYHLSQQQVFDVIDSQLNFFH